MHYTPSRTHKLLICSVIVLVLGALSLKAGRAFSGANIATIGGITATKTATLAGDANGNGFVNPGDTLQYSVVISNSGPDATGVVFTDTLNNNLTFVGGSVHAAPIAADETYNWVGNTQLDTSARSLPGITANDVAVTDSFTLNTTPASGPSHGSVTISSNGHFVYTPAVGYTGADSFTYSIASSADPTLTGTGTVTINLTGRVWYLQAGAAGDGRSNTPSSSPSAMSTAASASDIFYVFSNAGTLNGAFTLKNSQQLLGQGVGLTVNSINLYSANTTPTIANGSGDAVTLASANTLQGFNVGNTSGRAIFGTSVGALSINNVMINTTGAGLDLTGVSAPAVSVTLSSLTSSGGTKNVNLVGLGGAVSLGSGALSGASGNAFDVSGGTATITYSGTINNTAARSVNIASMTSGSVTLSGAVSGSGTGVNLSSNTGAMINFTGGLSLSTGSNAAFTATGGGTVTATQNNTTILNTLTTTTGTALNVQNTTIGVANLTFRSITAGTGAGSAGVGILLNNTGASGGLKVVGNNTAGSGGTIQHKTGADAPGVGNVPATTQGIGILMISTTGASFDRMQLNDFDNFAIYGSGVTGVTLNNSTVNGTNGNNTGLDEGSIIFDGLFGTSTFSADIISGGVEDNFRVRNSSGTANDIVITGCTFSNAPNDNLIIEPSGTANVTTHVTNNTFSGAGGDHFQTSTTNSATLNVVFTGNRYSNGFPSSLGGGITISGGNAGSSEHVNFNVSNNGTVASPLVGSVQGGAININQGQGAGVWQGQVSNNFIGNAAVANSGAAQSSGIRVENHSTSGTLTAIIDGNNINQWNNGAAINTQAGDAGNASNTGALNVAITNNVISNPGASSQHGIVVNAGAGSGSNTAANQACTDIKSNNINLGVTPPNGGSSLRLRQREASTVKLPGYGGSATDITAVGNFVKGQNSGTPNTASVAVSSPPGGGYTGGGACTSPSVPSAAQPVDADEQKVAPQESAGNSASMMTRLQRALRPALMAFASPVGYINISGLGNWITPTANTAELHGAESGSGPVAGSADSLTNTPPAIARDAEPAIYVPAGRPALTMLVNSLGETRLATTAPLARALSGEVITVNGSGSGFSLPSGKSTTIRFRATIGSGFTGTSITNQANVTATGGINVNSNNLSTDVIQPPTISKAFGASGVALNGTTSLTFTLNNPNPSTALSGVAFTDTLPAGLVVATPNGLSGVCGGAVTSAADSGSISLTGGTLAAGGSCTIAVNVKGTTPGAKNNVTGAITSTQSDPGGTASATTTVNDPPTISGQTITRQQGSAGTSATIATVADTEDAAGSLTVTTTSIPAGITVTGITNTSGTITATVAAGCSVATGNQTVGLKVTDSAGSETTANLTVNVTANTAPTLGTYSGGVIAPGGSTTITPSAAPADNGSVPSLTASAPGFTGTFSGNTSTGVISVSNAGPVGSYTVTVTATDNCGATTATTFGLIVNSPPTISGQTITRQQGSIGTVSTIATVNDTETAAGSLTVTTTSVPTGITVTGITNTNGTITANVAASCSATTGNNTVALQVADAQGATATANLTVNVTANAAPSPGTYPATASVLPGAGTTVTPSVAPSDNGTITGITASAPGFTGSFSVDSTTGVVTVSNAGPAGNYTVTVTATDNCNATANATFSLSVSAAPTITAASALARTQGAGPSNSTIATVSDDVTSAGSLTVTTTTVPTGLSVTNITNTNGTITADVAAACNATTGANTVVLTVTDGGGLTATASLTVNVAASALGISGQPASQSVSIGAPASFTVTPSGTGPFTYQWRKGGNPLSNGGTISGVTSATLSISAVVAGDAGSYDVVVTGACGNVTSNAATLTANNDAPVAGFGSSLQFPGDTGSYASTTGPDFTTFTKLVFEAWLKPSNITGRQTILSKSPVHFFLQDGKPTLEFETTSGSSTHASTTALQAGVWSYVVATWDGSTVKIFINGTEAYSGAAAVTLSSTSGSTLGIGIALGGGAQYPFSGRMDEIRIGNVNATVADVQDDQYRGLTGFDAALEAYYRCDEASGTTLTDASHHGRDATLTGSVTRGTDNPSDFTTNENTPASGRLFGYDINDDALTFSVVSQGSKGTVAITNAATGAFTYTPNTNANGADSFTFKVSDGALDSAAATIAVTINPVNNTPTITAASALTRVQGVSATETIATVSDVETAAGSLTVAATTVPAGLSVSNITNNNGTISATVAAGCAATTGANTVVLTVTDGDGATATANLTVNVTSNTPPTLGTYQAATVVGGNSTSVTPNAAPADNGTVTGVTVAAPNFTGVLSVDPGTGVVSISNAGPAGSYTVTVTATDNCGATATASFTLTVSNVSTTTALAPNGASVYGQSASFTATVTSGSNPVTTGSVTFKEGGTTLGGPVALNSSGQASFSLTTLTAGSHNITAEYGGASGFDSSSGGAMQTVSKAVLTVTADDKTKDYGAPLPTATATITGFVNGDTTSVVSGSPNLTINALAGSRVGAYPITAALGTLSAANYSFTLADGTLTIAKVALTVVASDATRAYGSANPTFTGTVTGVVNGDNITATFSTTADASSAAGSYAITPTLNDPASKLGNYNVTETNGTLTVTKVVLTVTADGKSKVYGSANPALTASYSGFVNGDSANVVSGSADLTTTAADTSGVGAYPITAAAGTLSAANYTFTFAGGTLTVTPATLTVTADNKSKAYGAALPALTASYSGFVNGDTAAALTGAPSVTTAATPDSAMGTYPITAAAGSLASPNYTFTFVNGTLTVTQSALTVVANDATRVYGAANPTFTGTISGLQGGDNITATYLTTADATSAAGTYAITPTLNDPDGKLSNYTVTLTGGTLTVTRAVLTVTASNQTKVYGAANPNFTANLSGFVNGDTASVVSGSPDFATVPVTSGVGASPITVTAGSLSAANYSFAFASGTLTITPAVLTVTANDQTKAYGAALPTLTASYAGFVNGDTAAALTGAPSLTTTALSDSNIGTYPITAAAGSLSSPNYTFVFAGGTLTVTKAALTVVANDATRAYGAANPTFTGTINGVVNNDNITATYATTADATSAAGTYAITPSLSDPDGKAGNYTVTLTGGTLTVSKIVLTVTADNKSKVYGAANPPLTVSYSGFVNGESAGVLTGTPSLTTATPDSGVGNYSITVTAGTLGAANYSFNFVGGTLTVTPAPLTVTANDQTKAYGAALPTLTASYAGFVNGDTAAALTGTPSVTTTATSGSAVGTYPLTAAVGSLASPNYTFTFVGGTLTITRAALTVVASDATRAYGSANPTFTGTMTGVVNGDNITATYATTADAQSAAGTYPITSSLSDPDGKLGNYTVTQTNGTLTVSKAVLTVTANNQTKVYGSANPILTATVSGFVNGDTISVVSGSDELTTTATAASGVGTYPITAAIGTLSAANYSFNFVGGTLTVTKAALTVAANDATRVYGAANPTFTGTIIGVVNNDNITATYTTTATESSAAGTYALTPALKDPDGKLGNYTATLTGGTLTVTKATLTVTADNKSKVFGAALPNFTASYAGFVNGDAAGALTGTLSLTTTATAESAVGTYSITAGGLTSGNYTISFVDGTLTVSKADTSTTITSSVNPAAAGQQITLTATVTAVAPGAGTPGSTVTFRDGANTLGTGTLNSSGQATFATSSLSSGSHSITAEFGGSDSFNASTSPALTQAVNVTMADLEITQAPAFNVVSGSQTITYTLTVANKGPAAAGDVTITDTLPEGTSFVSCTASNGGVCSGTGNTRTVTFASLASAEAATVTLTATISCAPGATSQVNTASVASSTADPDSSNNSATYAFSGGGAQLKVALANNQSALEFGPVAATGSPVSNPPAETFTLENTGCAATQFNLAISRTGAATSNGRIIDPDDSGFFPVRLVNGDGSETPLFTGAAVPPLTIAPGQKLTLRVFFNPVRPAPTGKTTGLAAYQALPETVTAQLVVLQKGGDPLTVSLTGHVAPSAKLVSPNGQPQIALVKLALVNDEFVVDAAIHDPNLDATQVRYEFLDSNGNAVRAPADFDLAQLIQQGSFTTGQSIALQQKFAGASGLPNLARVRVTVTDAAGSDSALSDLLGSTQPLPVISVSAANYSITGVSPESIAAAFGVNLATTTTNPTSLPLPTTLGGTTVKIRDSAGTEMLAPLFFVSPLQVNYLIPAGLVAGPATVTVTNADGTVSTGTVQIVITQPALFTVDVDGQPAPAALALRVRADGTQVYEPVTQFDAAQNKTVPVPINLGPESEQVYLVLFGTGIRFGGALSNVAVTIGDVTVPVEYSGVQGGFAGLDQVNLRLPRTLAGSGQKDLKLTISGIQANVVKISIQ